MNRTTLAISLVALLIPSWASAEIFRCQASGGAVSYQQMPCDDKAVGGPANIASEYPPVNARERERVFEQEAAMYKRLEAERDRLAQLAAVRAAAQPAPQAPADESAGTVYYPAYGPLSMRRYLVRGSRGTPGVHYPFPR
jgi:hypothetical protein